MSRGRFAPPNQSVGSSVIRQLHERYYDTWQLPWPHETAHLKLLWIESKVACGLTLGHRGKMPEVYARCLEAMREDHEIPKDHLDFILTDPIKRTLIQLEKERTTCV